MCTDCKELTIPTGAPGTNGTNGTNGAPGVKGDTGLTGANGQNGTTILATYNSTTGIGTDADILEKTLFTYNVPANTLANNGDELELYLYHDFVAPNIAYLRVKLGSKIILLPNMGSVNHTRLLQIKISRISATSQLWTIFNELTTITTPTIATDSSTVDLSTILAFEITGENTVAVANQLILKKATLYKYAI